MLDTMMQAPDELERAVCARRSGVVFAPELRPDDAALGALHQSWAQWFDIGDATTPSIYRHRWIVPPHGQLAIRRWETSRKPDIVYSFFNGSGLILWDNVFGAWNPYSREDRRLIAETAAIFDHYQDLLVHGDWLPLIPTGVAGLDANRWNSDDGRGIVTLRNRTTERLDWRVPADAPPGLTYVALWGDGHPVAAGGAVVVEPGGTQAVVLDDPARAARAVEHVQSLSRRAHVSLPGYDERGPPPQPLRAAPERRSAPTSSASMVALPAGPFTMKLRHERRECGCHPTGATDAIMWGWFYKDLVTHEVHAIMKPFAMRATAVTNADYLAFVHAAGYRPADAQAFLKHIARTKDGRLPSVLLGELGAHPVTYVSLDDARAYAAWHGQRLPTELEWQWAAEGAGGGNRYPWGSDERSVHGAMGPALDPSTATPQGVMGLSGNTWELTESEHTDGHTRFVMLRGGAFLPPGESEWLPARGARPNDSHAKYILLADGLDRSGSVSFRTVADLG